MPYFAFTVVYLLIKENVRVGKKINFELEGVNRWRPSQISALKL